MKEDSWKTAWQGGRVDGSNKAHLRWHQIVTFNASDEATLLGFCSDEGVRRNKGRQGAAAGPDAIRAQLRNLPVHDLIDLADAGNIYCIGEDLEKAQAKLSDKISNLLGNGTLPIILGGGHEVAWGHYLGIRQHLGWKNGKLGILNIDAHFDLRAPEDGKTPTSGTSFWHMHQDSISQSEEFDYMVLGVQKAGNTRALFDFADHANVRYIMAGDIHLSSSQECWEGWIAEMDHVYLTICLDAFSSSIAPGVSSPTVNGLLPGPWLTQLFNTLKESNKLISIDIAELNPSRDIDNRTAKLAASLIFGLLEGY